MDNKKRELNKETEQKPPFISFQGHKHPQSEIDRGITPLQINDQSGRHIHNQKPQLGTKQEHEEMKILHHNFRGQPGNYDEHNQITNNRQEPNRLRPSTLSSNSILISQHQKSQSRLRSRPGTNNLQDDNAVKSSRSQATSYNTALLGVFSVPNEDAMIFQNRGIGETQITLSENRQYTENLGSPSHRNTEFMRLFEYQNENNLLAKDKGGIRDFRRLFSRSYIIDAQQNQYEQNKQLSSLQPSQIQQENPFLQGNNSNNGDGQHLESNEINEYLGFN